jgi:hypothetical protein
LSVVLAGTLNASGQPEYKSIKPIIYLFPDRVVGYGPLTSTPIIPDKTDFQFQDFNMNIEQEKDLTLQELKNLILRYKAPAAINNKHLLPYLYLYDSGASTH